MESFPVVVLLLLKFGIPSSGSVAVFHIFVKSNASILVDALSPFIMSVVSSPLICPEQPVRIFKIILFALLYSTFIGKGTIN